MDQNNYQSFILQRLLNQASAGTLRPFTPIVRSTLHKVFDISSKKRKLEKYRYCKLAQRMRTLPQTPD